VEELNDTLELDPEDPAAWHHDNLNSFVDLIIKEKDLFELAVECMAILQELCVSL
jgi:hypothetical protein